MEISCRGSTIIIKILYFDNLKALNYVSDKSNIDIKVLKDRSSLEVIKLFFMLNSIMHGMYHALKCIRQA